MNSNLLGLYIKQKIAPLLKEEASPLSGKTLLNIDIQPEYENVISFDLNEWANFVNKAYKAGNRIVFLYNGYDTLGMISEQEYKIWLYDLGVKNKVLSGAIFYDKGYNFFRNPMDADVPIDQITTLVKYMISEDINDSRDIEEDIWIDFLQHNPNCELVVENLQDNEDCLNIPEVLEELQNYDNIVLTGGGRYECFLEIEICLDAIDKSYQTYSKYTY